MRLLKAVFLPHSLRLKFILFSGVIFLALFLVASYILISQSVDYQKQALISKARSYANLATKPIGDSYTTYYQAGYLKFREQLLDLLSYDKDISRSQIISGDSRILFDSIDLPGTSPTQESQFLDKSIANALASNQTTEIKLQNGDVGEIITPYFDDFNAKPFSVRYFISYESIYGRLNQIIFTTIFLTVTFLLVAVLGINFLVNRFILIPLGKIVLSAKRISSGNLNEKIELRTKDELTDLSGSLNQMTLALRKDIEQLRELDKLKDEFVVLASHNLRTPLTIIKGYSNLLEKNKKLTTDEVKALKGISDGTKTLEDIVESLLNLVSIETDKSTVEKTQIDLKQILSEVVDELSNRAKEKAVILKTELSPAGKILVAGGEKRTKQALAAVIDNAIKFNKEGGTVFINTNTEKVSAVISVNDQGKGISDDAAKRVFSKFNRASDSLTENAEGLGIGLYLAKLIIEANQGKIWFESSSSGTTFYIRLPLMEE